MDSRGTSRAGNSVWVGIPTGVPADLMDPFHRELYVKIVDELNQRVAGVASGSCTEVSGDARTVAEKYAAQVAYIRALQDVLALCAELERDRYGDRKKDDK